MFICTVVAPFSPRTVFSAGLSPAALSSGFAAPTVEYSADYVTTTGGISVTSRMYYAPGKERTEVNMGGGIVSATIIRSDKEVMWTLMPFEKKYIEVKLSGFDGGGMGIGVKYVEKGRETVNGLKTRKIEVTDFTGAVSTLWLTKENIPVRIETPMSDSNKEVIRIDLKNIKIGKQDPALFEVPAGYIVMDLSASLQELTDSLQDMQRDLQKELEELQKNMPQ